MGEPTQLTHLGLEPSQWLMGNLFFIREEELVEQIVSSYEKKSQNLPPDLRKACLGIVTKLAHNLYQDIDSLRKKGVTSIDLKSYASKQLSKIQGVVSPFFHKDDTLEKMAELGTDITALHPPSRHTQEHDEGTLSFGLDFLQGEVAHQIGEHFGEPYGLVVETVVGTLTNTDSKPMEDTVASAASHTTIIAGAELAAVGLEAEIPGYQIILGMKALGAVAKAGEEGLKKTEKYYQPVEGERPEPCLDDFCSSPLQATYQAEKLLQAAQLPSQAIHVVHQKLTEVSTEALKKVGLTEKNVAQGVKRFNTFVGEHPPVPGDILDRPTDRHFQDRPSGVEESSHADPRFYFSTVEELEVFLRNLPATEKKDSHQSLTDKVVAMKLSPASFGPPLAGAAAGVGISGLIGLSQKAAAEQAKEAALGAAQGARAAVWEAKWNQIKLEEMCEGIGELAAKNPNPAAYNNLGRELIQGMEKIPILERAVPPAEAAAKAAVERAAATEILPLGRTAIMSGVGAVLGVVALALTPSELGKE